MVICLLFQAVRVIIFSDSRKLSVLMQKHQPVGNK